jgi:CheY-like chemotaxis protein
LVLVIDDSDDILELFKLALEGAGYRVSVATDGRKGLEAALEIRPDLIITDISMPSMNGLQFLAHLRRELPPPVPPVLVCSGFDEIADEALRLGALRFVAKPVEVAALIQLAGQALRGELTNGSALGTERALLQAARARAVAAAARLFSTLKTQAPALDRALPLFAQTVADYFGFASAAVLFVENDGGVKVAGASRDCPLQVGTTFSGQMLFSAGVLASGSSLVIPDSAKFFTSTLADPRALSLGLKFAVAVPLLFEDVPIGAIGLVDRDAHPFCAENLLTLEGVGREASQSLRGSVGANLGFIPPSLFDRMLGAELTLLHRERGEMELLLVEMEQPPSSDLALEILERGGPRLALCRRETGTLALFKRDPHPMVAAGVIAATLSMLMKTGQVRATGLVSVVDAGLPPVPHEIVLRLAGSALEESRSTGRAVRLLLGRQPMPDRTTQPASNVQDGGG